MTDELVETDICTLNLQREFEGEKYQILSPDEARHPFVIKVTPRINQHISKEPSFSKILADKLQYLVDMAETVENLKANSLPHPYVAYRMAVMTDHEKDDELLRVFLFWNKTEQKWNLYTELAPERYWGFKFLPVSSNKN